MPSPFPGEQDTSYFEHYSIQQQVPLDGPPTQREPELESDADYIMENPFFSSINSSRAGGLHQDHETAFTPVRFTFGTDGTGWSRPLELSSPPPETAGTDTADGKDASTVSLDLDAIHTKPLASLAIPRQPQSGEDAADASSVESLEDTTSIQRSPTEAKYSQRDIVQPSPKAAPAGTIDASSAAQSSNVILLSSDVEPEHSEQEDEVMAESEDQAMAKLEEEQGSEDETESESEDEIEPSSEVHDTESEGDDVETEQVMLDDSQLHTEPDTTVDIESETGDHRPRVQEEVSVSIQAPTVVASTVNTDPPPAGKSNDNVSLGIVGQRDFERRGEGFDTAESHDQSGDADDVHRLDLRVGLTDKPTAGTAPDDFNNFTGSDVEQKHAEDTSPGPHQPIRELASTATPDTYERPMSVGFDDREPRLGTDESLSFVKGQDSIDAANAQVDTADLDIKMESVEDGSEHVIGQLKAQVLPQESGTGPSTELLTSVPESKNKIGELHLESVPSTAPARNTRSKTKSATSPQEEDGYMSRLSTSVPRARSKASLDLTNRESISPTHARGHPGSPNSPTLPRTSPYSLRSQSKQLSPDDMASSQSAPVRRSPRKLVRRDSDVDIVPSQTENRDVFGSTFEPSQELGFGYSQLSQGKHSDVGFVKDSEEDASHSEGSISTVQDSDGVEVVDAIQPATPRSKPAPAGVSDTQRQTRSRSRSDGQQSILESPTQPQHSPRRSPRLTRSTFSATPSPRVTRTTREPVQVSAPDVGGEHEREDLPARSDQYSIVYPLLPNEGDDSLQRSLAAPASAQRPPQYESNLLTPGDTQQTALELPLSFQARQPEQSLVTPELTQTTSASATLRSFDIPLPGVQTQPAPQSPVLRTSPRHKPAVAEVRSSSPAHQSSDAVSSPDADVASAQKEEPLPSIGLSTPMAYYTPLRDLIFFLNRSSQFHSGSHPDVLALCTAPSTAPTKAKKGPRHWSSTLHVTDLSVWPAIRTVNVFRPFRNALPVADAGDVILLRAFAVESRERQPLLRSQDESAWCVWRFGKTVWGAKKGKFGELRAREEVKGPVVERGAGEWAEVERLRGWFLSSVKGELERLREEREAVENGDANEVRVEEVEGGE